MLLQCNVFSRELKRNVDVNITVPTPDADDILVAPQLKVPENGFKVVYLLHGAFGDYSDWVRFTGIEKYGKKNGYVVIMPSGGNSFYQDTFSGENYYSFIAHELPELAGKILSLSHRREDTYIAGLSMGGYGAFFLALRNPEKYCCAASLSGGLNIKSIAEMYNKNTADNPFNFPSIFSNPLQLEGSPADLFHLATKQVEKGMPLPRFFSSCGSGDFLYDINNAADKRFKAIGLDIHYETHPGAHTWPFWDEHIQNAFRWFRSQSRKT